MQVLVCGSRDCRDAWIIETVLNGLYYEAIGDKTGKLTLYEGGQKQQANTGVSRGGGPTYIGADYLAARWAEYKKKQLSGLQGKMPVMSFEHIQTPAQWERYRNVGANGNPAGFIRNKEQLNKLLKNWKPDFPTFERAVCLGFLTKPREESHGTNHMMGLCEDAGIPTFPIDCTKGSWYVKAEARAASEQ